MDAVEKWLVKARLVGANIVVRDNDRGERVVTVEMPVRGGVIDEKGRVVPEVHRMVVWRRDGTWHCFEMYGTAEEAAILLSGWAWMYAGVRT